MSLTLRVGLVVGIICALAWPQYSQARVTITTSWERPVNFKVIDIKSSTALAYPLLILKTEKRVAGSEAALPFYDVIQGSPLGLADYRVSEKSLTAVIKVIVPGYGLFSRKLKWQELPPRQLDSAGIETSVPTITLEMTPLDKPNAWLREYRLVILPELDDILPLSPPYLSQDEKRLIDEFLRREDNRQLGL